MLMRLFSSSDKHSLQKICSQHLVQINLVVNLINNVSNNSILKDEFKKIMNHYEFQ